jgi:hypothetical protein
MTSRALLILMAVVSPAAAQSQHPRSGELCALAFSDRQAAGLDQTTCIGEVAGWLRDHPDGRIVIDAYGDSAGSPTDRLDLSLRRAEAVRTQLTSLGADRQQIVIAAFQAADAPPTRRVVIWGTHVGLDVIEARTARRGGAYILQAG